MSRVKRLLEEKEERRDWAVMLLTKYGALKNCKIHDYLLDAWDSDALNKAIAKGTRKPPKGLTADQAETLIREVLNEHGDECPDCAEED